MVQNKGLIYKSHPKGLPVAGEYLVIEDRPIHLNADAPENGIITRNFEACFDPYLHGRMRPQEVKSYSPAFQLGKRIENDSTAHIKKSNTPEFKPADLIKGPSPLEEYSILSGDAVKGRWLRKLDNRYNLDVKLFLAALGMPGLTAHSSLYKIGEPKKGETIFISSASVAVGPWDNSWVNWPGAKV